MDFSSLVWFSEKLRVHFGFAKNVGLVFFVDQL